MCDKINLKIDLVQNNIDNVAHCHPSSNTEHWSVILDKFPFRPNLGQRAVHLIWDLVIPLLFIACNFAVHLVLVSGELLRGAVDVDISFPLLLRLFRADGHHKG